MLILNAHVNLEKLVTHVLIMQNTSKVPSITEHGLCEDFPKNLFGGPPAAGSAEKSFSMKMFGEHVRAKNKPLPVAF